MPCVPDEWWWRTIERLTRLARQSTISRIFRECSLIILLKVPVAAMLAANVDYHTGSI